MEEFVKMKGWTLCANALKGALESTVNIKIFVWTIIHVRISEYAYRRLQIQKNLLVCAKMVFLVQHVKPMMITAMGTHVGIMVNV